MDNKSINYKFTDESANSYEGSSAKKLIELLEESGLSEIEITEGDDKVRITKGGKSLKQGTITVIK